MSRPHKAWTDAEVALLTSRLSSGDPIAVIAAELGRTPGAVEIRARILGIKIAPGQYGKRERAASSGMSAFNRIF